MAKGSVRREREGEASNGEKVARGKAGAEKDGYAAKGREGQM